MSFFAFFNCYTLRINLSVAIVAMVNATYLRELEAVSDRANETEARWSCDGDDSASNENNATTLHQVWFCHCFKSLTTPTRVAGVLFSPAFVCLSVCLSVFARYLKN